MAEVSPKRHREEEEEESVDASTAKRQKPCNNTLNLLYDDEEQEPTQDLSAIFTTFDIPSTAEVATADEDESLKSLMRHLLEASDDELGIPNAPDEGGVRNSNSVQDSPLAFTDDNGLWELDDVAANYYTLLQSQLFHH